MVRGALAERIREARLSRDLTQEAVSIASNVALVTVARTESGGIRTSDRTLVRIGKVLGLDQSELVTLRDLDFPPVTQGTGVEMTPTVTDRAQAHPQEGSPLPTAPEHDAASFYHLLMSLAPEARRSCVNECLPIVVRYRGARPRAREGTTEGD
jgi:transcriptional regulator with XRE-family HTH domain